MLIKLSPFFLLIFSFNLYALDLPTAIHETIESVAARGNSEISAKIHNSTVTLIGIVSSSEIKSELISKVSGLDGVSNVVDNIEVKESFGKEIYADSEIKAAIEKSLNEVNLKYDSLKVNNGIVEVSANMNSFRDVDSLLSIILTVKGVKDVKTDMRVKSQPYLSHVTKNY